VTNTGDISIVSASPPHIFQRANEILYYSFNSIDHKLNLEIYVKNINASSFAKTKRL